MSSNNENENIEVEEESTIFAAHEYKETKKRSNKGLKAVAALLVVLLLSGGVYAINVFMPKKATEDTTTTEAVIKVTDKVTSDITAIAIKNTTDTFTVIPFASKDSSGKATTSYKLKGYDKVSQNVEMVTQLGDQVQSITATRQVTDDNSNLKGYGLDKPVIEIKVTLKNGKVITTSFGAIAPDKSGYYAKTTLKPGIFLVSNDIVANFNNSKVKYANLTTITPLVTEGTSDSYFSQDGKLAKFDTLFFGGSLRTAISIKYDETNATTGSSTLFITSPKSLYADQTKCTTMLEPLTNSFTADAAYVLAPTATDLKKYNLQNPQTIVTYVVKEKTYTIKLSTAPDEGFYVALVNNNNIIYKIPVASVTFFNWQLKDVRSTLQFLENITSIKTMTVTVAGKSTVFNLTTVKATDGTETTTTVSNGKKIIQEDVSSFYLKLLSLSPADYSEKIPSVTPYLTFKIEYNTTKKADTIEFRKYSDLYYFYTIGNKGDVLVDYKKVEQLGSYVGYLTTGKTIPTD